MSGKASCPSAAPTCPPPWPGSSRFGDRGRRCLLFEDSSGRPCVRRPNGRWEAVVPGAPPIHDWLRIAQEWLAEPANAGAALSEVVTEAVENWRLPAA